MLIVDPALGARLGDAAHQRATERFLALQSLVDYGRLIVAVDDSR